MNDEILDLYAQIGALTYACDKALTLLIASRIDAHETDKVIDLLEIILKGQQK
jgi:hypothetical protein